MKTLSEITHTQLGQRMSDMSSDLAKDSKLVLAVLNHFDISDCTAEQFASIKLGLKNAILEASKVGRKKYARKCDATGEGMNDGIVYLDGEKYFKDIKTFVKFLISQGGEDIKDISEQELVNESYAQGEHYYTEWEDEEDFQYQVINGELVEIE